MRYTMLFLMTLFMTACGGRPQQAVAPIDVRVDRNLQAFDHGPQTIFEQNLIKVPGTITEKRIQQSKVVGFTVDIGSHFKAPIRGRKYKVSIHSSTLIGLQANTVTMVFTEEGQVFRILLPGRD